MEFPYICKGLRALQAQDIGLRFKTSQGFQGLGISLGALGPPRNWVQGTHWGVECLAWMCRNRDVVLRGPQVQTNWDSEFGVSSLFWVRLDVDRCQEKIDEWGTELQGRSEGLQGRELWAVWTWSKHAALWDSGFRNFVGLRHPRVFKKSRFSELET